MRTKGWLLGLLALAMLLLAACNLGKEKPAASVIIDPNAVATSVAATLAAELASNPAPTETLPAILPHSVYFLSSASGSPQVWRLGVDGHTPQQFSDEPAGVDYFDVSRADGRVAVVSGNRLLLLSADASERSVLVDASGNDTEALDYRYRGVISEPRFSPDGGTLAYGLGGVNLLDPDSGESRLVLVSNVDESDVGAVRPGELFFPEAWSPDGKRLLVSIGFLEGGSLGVLDAESGEFTALQAQGILCCHPAWAPDSQSVVVASPYYGIITPGLWRYAADTGTQRVLAPGVDATESYHFFGWPLDTGNELFYFYASSAGFPDGTLPLRMARSDTDGVSNRVELSEERFSIRESLWVEDGSLALIVEAAEKGSGPLLLVNPAEGQVQVLSPEAEHLRWGP